MKSKQWEETVLENGGIVVMLGCNLLSQSNFTVTVYKAAGEKLWNKVHEYELHDSRTYYRHSIRYQEAARNRFCK